MRNEDYIFEKKLEESKSTFINQELQKQLIKDEIEKIPDLINSIPKMIDSLTEPEEEKISPVKDKLTNQITPTSESTQVNYLNFMN